MPLNLTYRAIALGFLAAVFLFVSLAVTGGALDSIDQWTSRAMTNAWWPPLQPLAQGVAELGGIELTAAVMCGMLVYLLRRGFGGDAWVVVSFGIAEALEVLYKTFLNHPAPPRGLAHADGPSLTLLLPGEGGGNSFPSGHVVRAMLVYGLTAFVVARLARSDRVRRIAVVGAALVVAIVSLDRLYLNVHWASDVLGGLLLGAIALTASTIWLDRPRKGAG